MPVRVKVQTVHVGALVPCGCCVVGGGGVLCKCWVVGWCVRVCWVLWVWVGVLVLEWVVLVGVGVLVLEWVLWVLVGVWVLG